MKFLLIVFVLGSLFAAVSGVTCNIHQFECFDGSCIPSCEVCDGAKHCRDGSDEVNCPPPKPCDGFACDRGYQCLLEKYVCDGQIHCHDETDEEPGCECKGFKCKDGTCLHKSRECNNVVDCIGGDDEHDNCPTFAGNV